MPLETACSQSQWGHGTECRGYKSITTFIHPGTARAQRTADRRGTAARAAALRARLELRQIGGVRLEQVVGQRLRRLHGRHGSVDQQGLHE